MHNQVLAGGATATFVTFGLLAAGFVLFLVFFGGSIQLLANCTKRKEQRKSAKEWEKTKDLETRGQYRDRMTMEAAIRNTQQKAPPAGPPPSLSTQLADLNNALQAGLITGEDAKKRANIIAGT